MDTPKPDKPPNDFPSTITGWLKIMQDRDDPGHAAAQQRFAEVYSKPIFYFLRVKGYPYREADELTWDFLGRFFEKRWAVNADPQRGRFRSYLITVLKRFVSDQGLGRANLQDESERTRRSLTPLTGEEERSFEPADNVTPESEFWGRWRRELIERVLARLQEKCRDDGEPQAFDVFHAYRWPNPGEEEPTQQVLAERFGQTRDQINYMLEQTTKRCRRLLRTELREHCDSEEEIDDEIRQLLR